MGRTATASVGFERVGAAGALLVAALGFAPTALAQPIPLPPVPRADIQVTREQGYEFVTVNDPSVTPIPSSLRPFRLNPSDYPDLGRVTEPFRISRTEVTTAEQFEFMRAWLPHSTPELRTNIEGLGIGYTGGDGTSISSYRIRTGRDRWSASLPWRVAAIYCNWLHNDKRTDAAAFMSGVYDVSTFGYGVIDAATGEQGYTDQREPSPGARFFIPSLSQMHMARHWDPNRFGEGQGGWWAYSIGQDTVPVGGAPGTPGAQCDAGVFGVPTLSYLNTQSPWGLFDTVGGAREWTSTAPAPTGPLRTERTHVGSFGGGDAFADSLTRLGFSQPLTANGFRIAAAIPAPSSSVIVLGGLAFTRRRR